MEQSFDRARLNEAAQRSFDLWIFLLDRAKKAVRYRRHEYVFGRNGPHTALPNFLINYHKVYNLEDLNAYVSRIRATGSYFNQYLDRAKLAAAAGIQAPYFNYDVAQSQIKRVTTGEPFTTDGTSALWRDLNNKLSDLIERDLATKPQADAQKAKARSAIIESMMPACATILAWREVDHAHVSKAAQGASALPNGKAFYAHRLELMTTLPLTADDIHRTGLQEKLPEFFGILPKGPLQVRRIEAFREPPGAAAHYMRGTKDGSRAGVFYLHLADMRAVSIYRLENLSYHEGLPGHHLQIAIQQELQDIPRFRTHHGYTAFSEGWGLYAEYLGKEMGFY